MSQLGKSLVFATVVTSLTLIVFPVSAQITGVSGSDCSALGISCTGNETPNSLIDTIQTIVNAFLVLVGIVAAIYLVMGGLRYVTSEGDDNQTAKAKHTILFAVIGLIVIGISAVIVNFVIVDVLGNASGQGGSPTGNQTFQQVPVSR